MSNLLSVLSGLLARKPRPTDTVGVGGTTAYGGYLVSNEKSPLLSGRQKYVTYSDILANTSIVAAGTRYVLGLISGAAWKVEPGEGPRAKEIAELVESMLYDMSTPWNRIVRRTSLYPYYGYSIQEWTAKKRKDGYIGLMDVEARPQSTIERWEIDTSGTVHGVTQRSPHDQRELYIPRGKIVYAVDDSLTDSPEGLGLFRHVVEAAQRLRRYEQLEGFGFEMDLRGIPVGRGPFAVLSQMVEDGKLTKEQKAAIEQPLKDFIGNHIKSPQLGLLLDSITYHSKDEGNTPSDVKQWDMELMKGEAGPMPEVAAAIERLNRELARVLGTENLLLGEKGGSLALSRDKSTNIATLVDGTLQGVCEVYDRDLITPIMELNGWPEESRPYLKTDKVQLRDVEQVTMALKEMAAAGATLAPDDPAINEVRNMLGLTEIDLDQMALDAAAQREAELAVLQAKAKPAGESVDEEEVGKAINRHPKGSEKGGQFAPKSGSGGGASGSNDQLSTQEQATANKRLDDILKDPKNHDGENLSPAGMRALGFANDTMDDGSPLLRVYGLNGMQKDGSQPISPFGVNRAQSHIPINGLRAYIRNMPKELPDIIRANGKMYVASGHTRLGVHMLAGRNTIQVQFWKQKEPRKR